MKRDIIKIDDEKCTGCGQCVPNCHEGALQIIDNKVRLVSELMCDGLGACIGHCPEGAITIEKREAEPYNEVAVMSEMVTKGVNTVIAHLKHLKEHGEEGYLKEGVTWLRQNSEKTGIDVNQVVKAVAGDNHGSHDHNHEGSCPGSRERTIAAPSVSVSTEDIPSELRHWPVQMHLINPNAPHFHGADMLLAADCVAFSLGSFHNKFLRGHPLAIACPKLDSGSDVYIEKLVALIDIAKVNTITVMIMEVPCCGGLLQMVRMASEKASRKVPVKLIIVSIEGKILRDEWV
jgi:NAD-dependent dihydropyrimidine dehydrogenase PreA subunit